MIFIQIAPEHVLHAICSVEDACAQALRSFFQCVEEHALAVFVIAVALRQECVVVEHFFVQRPGILRQTESRVRTKKLCQVNRICYGMRNWQVGMSGIDVHRRNVHLNLGRDLFQIEAANATGRESHARLEFHRNPLRVLTHFDGESFRLDFDPCLAAFHIWTQLEVGAQLAARPQRVLRAGDIGMKSGAIALDRNAHAALAKLVAACPCGAKAECSLASLEIGHAHAGKQHARKLLWRKGYRHANDRAEDARLAQPVPERRPLAQTFDVGFAQRERILANLQMPFGLADLRR